MVYKVNSMKNGGTIVAEKVRVLIIGGDERRNLPKTVKESLDYVHVPSTRDLFPVGIAPGVEVVVTLVRWLARSAWRLAQDISQRRKIPLIQARTGNYIIEGLLKASTAQNNFKARIEAHLPKDSEPAEEDEPAEEKSTEIKTDSPEDWTVEKLWEYYGKRLIEIVKALMLPNEKLDQDELFPILADELSVPPAAITKLMTSDELKVKGVIVNTVDTTWKRVSAGGDYQIDVEPAPKPAVSKELRNETLTFLIAGLPAGPYQSKWAISGEMLNYREFVTKDGKPLSRSYGMVMVNKAIELGIIKEQPDETYVIEHDEKIKLVPNKPVVAPKSSTSTKPKPKEEQAVPAKVDDPVVRKVSTDYVPLSKMTEGIKPPPAVEAKVESPLPDSNPKKALGQIERCELMPDQLKLQKSLLPGRDWDIAAQNEICSRLQKAGLPAKPLPKGIFTTEEWDGLAWACLAEAKYRHVALRMRGTFEDEKCVCFDCGEEFVFTKGEKQWMFEQFGDVKTPKRCQPCRKARREGDDVDARIPNRWS